MVTVPDFVRIQKTRIGNKGDGDIYQLSIDFNVGDLKDIVIQGGVFVKFYNPESGFWESKSNFYAFARKLLYEQAEIEKEKYPNQTIIVADPQHLSSKVPTKIDALCKACEADPILFDQKILWSGETPKREDYATCTMPYSLSESSSCPSYDALMSVLYSPEDRTMLEWLAGAALCGNGRKIDKFVYLEGEPGSGKSTFLEILAAVFGPYGASIKAEEFTSLTGTFATGQLKKGPLVAIQYDGDLSKIETNTTLNNIISHEPILINDKYAKPYYLRLNTLLFIASNYSLRLTDSMSGLLRRVLDPTPTGKLIPIEKYTQLYSGAMHELGGIARRFIDVYRELGTRAYNGYRSNRIVRTGNALGYWVERVRDIDWSKDGECLLSQEYSLYRSYCDANATKIMSRSLFERQLRFFWDTSVEEISPNGTKDVRFIDYQWKRRPFQKPIFSLYEAKDDTPTESTEHEFLRLTVRSDAVFVDSCGDCPAQYAKENGTPDSPWRDVATKLSNIVSTELHYVLLSGNHIVVDLDCRDEAGAKNKEICFRKIQELGLPPTYAEFSRSGEGIHLHYIYDGDPSTLTSLICEGVEVKVFKGNASLRRKFSYSNGLPIAHISSGIPLKEKKVEVVKEGIKDAKHLENIVAKGLRGEYGSHKVTIEFIDYIVRQAKEQGVQYDLSCYYDRLLFYAAQSTNHSQTLPDIVKKIPLKNGCVEEQPIVFFDVEVFPNYNCLCWKIRGSKQTNRERFPTVKTVEYLLDSYRLIGFNNKAYDNVMLDALLAGASPTELYSLSKMLIAGKTRVSKQIQELSYSDIFDFCNTKQSLKKWEVQLGIHHQECQYDWDKDLPETAFDIVDTYCCNDVEASEAVFEYNQDDWNTRLLLAYLTGMTPNSSTNELTAQLIFGDDLSPQDQFVYTDLSTIFPGYEWHVEGDRVVSTYHNKTVSEGGYVMATLGYRTMVGVNDVESMHPTSACELNIFGKKYTDRFRELVNSRKAAKNSNEEFIRSAFDGKIWEFIQMTGMKFKKLAKSLKVPINAVYGLTSAKFKNRFKDPRNVDNIVAKRGALMMITLQDELSEDGITPIHIKTDSIKIDNFTQEINDKIVEFGKRYGYRFTIEEFYTVFCLFNKSEYIAYNAATGEWESRGDTFQNQYVFKRLFGGEIKKEDFLLTKSVNKGYIHIGEKFYGKNVNVIAVKSEYGGPMLRCVDGKDSSVTGTKGQNFMEYEEALLGDIYEYLDMGYYDAMVEEAKAKIEMYVPFDVFMSHAHDPIPDIPCLKEINEAIRKRGGV